jgi:hypothetical protein
MRRDGKTTLDPGEEARDWYVRRIAEIEEILRSRDVWTVADWELLGARAILIKALLAETAEAKA